MTRIPHLTLVVDYNPVLLLKILNKVSGSNNFLSFDIGSIDYHKIRLELANRIPSAPPSGVLFFDLSLDTVAPREDWNRLTFNSALEPLKSSAEHLARILSDLSSRHDYVIFNHISPATKSSERNCSLSGATPAQKLLCNQFMAELTEKTININNLVFIHQQHNKINHKSLFYLDCPYGHDDLAQLSEELNKVLTLIYQKEIKVICLDLDNTLWGGILGEVGKSKIDLGGISPKGRAYQLVQELLLELNKKGILLAIASKNTDAIARDALTTHPDMVLTCENFSSLQINWGSKAESLKIIASDLNLSLDYFVFVDDNPREIEEVSQAHPEVQTIDFGGDPIRLVEILSTDVRFQKLKVTEADMMRAEDYKHETKRQQEIHLLADHNRNCQAAELLQVKVLHEDYSKNFDRCLQLLNKTNQFNSIGNRYSEKSFLYKTTRPEIKTYSYRAQDKHGSYGLICVVSARICDDTCVIEDFVLSCRAIGRGIEEAALIHAISQSKTNWVYCEFEATDRNKPVMEFYEKYGLICQSFATNKVSRIELIEKLQVNSAELRA